MCGGLDAETKEDTAFVCIDSLPNDKILDWHKFKAFAEDNLHAIEKLKFVMGRVENMVGKRRKL